MDVKALSKLADFRLVDNSQDIRGRPIYDREGNRLGTIDELLVDIDEQIVRYVRLDDGRRVPTEVLNIEEGGVFVDRAIVMAESELPPSPTPEPTPAPEDSRPPVSPVDHPPPDYPPSPGEPAP